MSLILLFHSIARKSFPITDESTDCLRLPNAAQADALLLKCSTEMALSLDMEQKVAVGGSDTVLLRGRCLFTILPPESERLWLASAGIRPLHPHEMQTAKLRGNLPEVICGPIGLDWLHAQRLHARCGLHLAGELVVEHGWIELVEWFGATATAQTTERGFTG
jgi:hypothetical protein